MVATNDVHYIKKEHSHAHDSLICIGTQSQLNDTKRMSYVPEQFYLRSAEEMAELFKEIPDAVTNTLEVAEKCELEIFLFLITVAKDVNWQYLVPLEWENHALLSGMWKIHLDVV